MRRSGERVVRRSGKLSVRPIDPPLSGYDPTASDRRELQMLLLAVRVLYLHQLRERGVTVLDPGEPAAAGEADLSVEVVWRRLFERAVYLLDGYAGQSLPLPHNVRTWARQLFNDQLR
jgi:hypothetical protein